PKLTLNLGLRYELQGTWSERFDRLTYFDPKVTNATVTGCSGTAGSPCLGDALLVKTGPNHTRNNLPLNKKAFSPRLGFAYNFDPKTVVRGGYGIFWIPNYVSFGVNPDRDLVSLARTPPRRPRHTMPSLLLSTPRPPPAHPRPTHPQPTACLPPMRPAAPTQPSEYTPPTSPTSHPIPRTASMSRPGPGARAQEHS